MKSFKSRMPMLKIFTPKLIYSFFVLIFALIIIIIYASLPPHDFPEKKIVQIKSGQHLSGVSETLVKENIVKSELVFKGFVFVLSGHRQVRAADYLFDEPQSALRVAYRIVKGEHNLPVKKITIIEGMTAENIGKTIKSILPKFDTARYLILAKLYEGYLFPDTYYFYENTTPEDVIDQLRNTFKEKIKTKLLEIQAFGKPLQDIITMASIVEKEATSTKDRKIIAGILWKRIEIGMPLQVDPPFYYVFGKDSSEITLTDLATDSPYNTYKRKGLPPTPIGNPGLDAIEATITPTKTNYLFYLSDKKGNMHYAIDHDGHVVNKAKYLR